MTTEALVGIRTSGFAADIDWLPATLDRWQQDGGVTAVFVATLCAAGYATTPHPRYYANTILGPPQSGANGLEPVLAEATKRELAVYSTLSEATEPDQARRVPGWVDLLEVDVFGRRGMQPCFRNPDYRSWWLSIVEDQVKSYSLDGLCISVDRVTPLGGVLGAVATGEPAQQSAPVCFCTFCQAQAARTNVDVDRAREGYRQLLDPAGPTARAVAGGENPAVVLFRILLRFPDVVAWESLWLQGYLGLQQQLFGTAKAIAPKVSVGWEIPEQYASSPLYRAEDPLAERSRYADFVVHSTVRRQPVTRNVLGLRAETADAFARDALTAVVQADTTGAGPDRPQTYVDVRVPGDVEPALAAGADGVIYAQTLGTDTEGPQLKSAARAVTGKGDTP